MDKNMKCKKRLIGLTVAIFLVMLFFITGCHISSGKKTVIITRPHPTTAESTVIKESEFSAESSSADYTESSISIRLPMNPITAEDFRNVCKQFRYRVSDINYEGSGIAELLSGGDSDWLYYVNFSQYSNEDLASAGIQDCYDRNLKGEAEGGFEGEISLEEKEGYDILVAKSTDDNVPSYAVYIRVDTVIIDAFCFSTEKADIKVINDFFAHFSYSVEG
jgi:hypothetical protein